MARHFCLGLALGLMTGLFLACGETVNYETREKLVTPENIQDLSRESANVESQTSGSEAEPVLVPTAESFAALCNSPSVQHKTEILHFPEIPLGTTCSFASGENLSRKDGWIRAYHRQNQEITLPAGARLCGFSIDPAQKSMRYDDEMLFLVEDRILIATKDYTEYFPIDGLFHRFSWEALRDKVYNQFDSRALYCVGGKEGLSECQLPATDTAGTIELNFTTELSNRLASLLQEKEVLQFSWITTGDNDDSDCRHSDISLPIVMHYLPAESRP